MVAVYHLALIIFIVVSVKQTTVAAAVDSHVARSVERSEKNSFLSVETTSILNLISSTFLLVVVWLILKPILDGSVTIVRNDDSKTSRSDEYATNFDASLDYLSDDGYYEDPYYNSWNVATAARSVGSSLWQRTLGQFESLDLLNSTFLAMHVQSDVCKAQMVCMVEARASQNPIFRLVIDSVSPWVRGLEQFQDALDVGRTTRDCRAFQDLSCPLD